MTPTLKDALALLRAGDLKAARDLCDALLAGAPAHFDALHLRGLIALQGGKAGEAETFLARAMALNGGNATAHLNHGNALRLLKRHAEALAAYDRALALKPQLIDAHHGRALMLQALGQHEAALASFDAALAGRPDDTEALNHRGLLLMEMRRNEDALASFEAALARKPEFIEARLNRSVILGDLGRRAEALAGYEHVVAAAPDHADARWNMSFALLQLGEYERGWREHEWRAKSTRLKAPPPSFPQPLWTGEESVAGKRILIYADQGYGDTLQFCRYIPLVRDLGATVIFKVQRALVPLLKNMDGVAHIIGTGDEFPPFDLHCSLASLPFFFATTLATIPAADGYLTADAAKTAAWRAILGSTARPRIGLAWSGNPEHLNDRRRSLALADLMQRLPSECDYISLQKDLRDRDRAALTATGVRFVGDELLDFSDTAALCALMDVVISVDTSVAHLAGALGKPVWVLLPFNPDWRWLLNRSDSPWYAAATLYRQERDGDWTDVLERVAAAARRLLGS